jgi:hypothetical protein
MLSQTGQAFGGRDEAEDSSASLAMVYRILQGEARWLAANRSGLFELGGSGYF